MAQAARPRRRSGEFGSGRKFTPRRKVCLFCVDKIDEVDYKDVNRLRRFLSDRGKIEPRRKTGTCATHQRSLNTALKRARHLALLPFTAEHIRVTGVLIREPGTSPRGPRGGRPEGAETDGAAPGAEAAAEAGAQTPAEPAAEPATEAAAVPEATPESAPAEAADAAPAEVAAGAATS